MQPLTVSNIHQAVNAGVHYQRCALVGGQFGLMIELLLYGCGQLFQSATQPGRFDAEREAL